jgi:hypothetical protein
MLIIFCASASTGRQFNRDNNITMIIATIVGTIAQSALIAFMLLCFANTTQSWLPIIKQLPTQLLINLGTIILITVLKQPVVEITQQQKLHRNQRSQSSWG